jgi:hypothetical protein
MNTCRAASDVRAQVSRVESRNARSVGTSAAGRQPCLPVDDALERAGGLAERVTPGSKPEFTCGSDPVSSGNQLGQIAFLPYQPQTVTFRKKIF